MIAVPDSLKEKVKDVSPDYWQIQAIEIDHGQSKTLLFNVYLPIDKKSQNAPAQELEESLQVISQMIRNTECNRVIVAGDLNYDISRNTIQTRTVCEFLDELSLTPVWNKFPIDFTHLLTAS